MAACRRRSASARRSASRTLRYRRLRFPDVASYPGALLNEIVTAFIDEAVFRGAVLGLFLGIGARADLAILGQA